jgi:hypothetical protein
VDMTAINGGGGQNDVNTNGTNVPLWGEFNSNNLLNIQPFDQGTQTMGQIQYDPNDPRAQDYQLPVPEVPTSSLALSLGAFVGDTSVRDVLFANDSFW